jgi:seryl-tRNA synthetase
MSEVIAHHTCQIDVEFGEDASIIEELEYRLNFIDGARMEVAERQAHVFWPAESQAIERKVREAIATLGTQKQFDRGVIFESDTREPINREHAFEHLLREREVIIETRGVIALGETVTSLVEYFDSRFLAFAESLHAEKREYPALMASDILDRCQYFSSFPQYVGFVSHVIEDPHLYNEFGTAWKQQGDGSFSQDHFLKVADCVLSPAVCYHCYNALEGSKFAQDAERVVTARGKCFRYEASNMIGLERLWEFSMREVVFIGSAAGVRSRRQTSLMFAKELVNELGLVGRIEVATDPFFVSSAKEKRTYQAGFQLKYELRLDLPAEGKTLAVASFNIHESFFGHTFNISLATGDAASTGCTAFGLERWAYAFLAQYGFDRSKWPQEIARFVEQRLQHNKPNE